MEGLTKTEKVSFRKASFSTSRVYVRGDRTRGRPGDLVRSPSSLPLTGRRRSDVNDGLPREGLRVSKHHRKENRRRKGRRLTEGDLLASPAVCTSMSRLGVKTCTDFRKGYFTMGRIDPYNVPKTNFLRYRSGRESFGHLPVFTI